MDIAGQLSIQVPEDAVRTLLTEQFFDPSQIEEIMTGLVTDVPVVAEGGGWLLCADIVMTRPPTPASSPAG